MRRLQTIHWLALVLFFSAPVAVFSPKAEILLIVFSAAPLLAHKVFRKSYRTLLKAPAVIILAFLLLWGGASAIWALDPMAALQRSGTLTITAFAAVMLIGASDFLTTNERDIARKAAVIGLTTACAFLILELLAGLPLNTLLRGTEHTPKTTVLNGALSIAAIFVWPVILILRQAEKTWFATSLLFVVIFVLILGENNSARVAFTLAALAAALTFCWQAIAIRGLVIIVMLGILAAPLLPGSVLSPAHWSKILPQVTDSAIHRLHIWHFTAERIAEKPLTGWGLDASRIIPGGDVEVIKDGASMQLHPHNAPLQVWLELGAMGAFGLVAIVCLPLLTAMRLPREAQAISLATTIAALVIASLSFGIWQHWWLATLALAATTSKLAFTKASPPAT